MANINLHLGDCLEAMKGMEDNQFDLAIVDPPYGIEFSKERERKDGRFRGAKKSDWDNAIPSNKYFEELIRVSKNQIIWGGNYFPSIWGKGCRGFIFWNKHQPVSNFADGEFAWTSFDRNCRYHSYPWYGNIDGKSLAKEKRIHITQKPVALYKWLLKNYAKPGDKILDTHAGSFSIGIACHDMGFDLEAYEIDEDYYTAALKRFKDHTKQLGLFTPTKEKKEVNQSSFNFKHP